MFKWLMTLTLLLSLSGCGYNTLQSTDEEIKATWGEVLNQYQRRADLIPNLVNVVKGYAAHEKEVLTQITQARASVGAIQATPELVNNEEAFKKFIAAQGQMTSALSRLMVVAENYPQLKADASFRDLQAQLEGTENRITVARNRYISAIKDYNITVRSFPTNLTAMMFGHKTKPSFSVENERAVATPPTVDFGASQVTIPATAPAPQALPAPQPSAFDPATVHPVINPLTAHSNWIQQLGFGIFLLLLCATASALVAIPALTQRVTDLTATLTPQQATDLENKLATLETQKGSQLAVLIVPTTQPEDIAQFGIRVADAWKIGRNKIDDGVILIVAKNDRKLRIEVGYGLEGAIPDVITKRVIAETIAPYFKTGDFAGGIDAGITQLAQLISGESLPAPVAQGNPQQDDSTFMLILIAGVFAGWFLSAIFGRTLGGTFAALGSGAIAALLLGMGFSIMIGLLVFFIVGIRQSSGRGWSSGSGGFGGGGFGGGGGGFSGGGGGFGGGGASGSW